MSTNSRLVVPKGARIVKAAGTESSVSLSDEVADMPPERRAAFTAALDRLYQAEVDLVLEEGDVLL